MSPVEGGAVTQQSSIFPKEPLVSTKAPYTLIIFKALSREPTSIVTSSYESEVLNPILYTPDPVPIMFESRETSNKSPPDLHSLTTSSR